MMYAGGGFLLGALVSGALTLTTVPVAFKASKIQPPTPFPPLKVTFGKDQQPKEAIQAVIRRVEACLKDRFKRAPISDYESQTLVLVVTIPGEEGAGYDRVLVTDLQLLLQSLPQGSGGATVVVRTSQQSYLERRGDNLRSIDPNSSAERELESLREEVRVCLTPWTSEV